LIYVRLLTKSPSKVLNGQKTDRIAERGEGRGQRAKGREQKAEGRRQKAEAKGRGQRANSNGNVKIINNSAYK
jgi:hypothetical protein